MEPFLLVALSLPTPQYSERYFDLTDPCVYRFQIRVVDDKTP